MLTSVIINLYIYEYHLSFSNSQIYYKNVYLKTFCSIKCSKYVLIKHKYMVIFANAYIKK